MKKIIGSLIICFLCVGVIVFIGFSAYLSQLNKANSRFRNNHLLLKNLADICLLVDSKVVETMYDEETADVYVKYENGVSFLLHSNLTPTQSCSTFTYPKDTVDEKEYLSMMTKDYFENSLIEKIITEGEYSYKDADKQIVNIKYSSTEETECIELIFE